MREYATVLTLLIVAIAARPQDATAQGFRWAGSGEYDPSAEHPVGRLNPAAPPETEQFAFMLGKFSCVDRRRQQDGSWTESQSTWNANYFMNGLGIIDHNSGEETSTSNIRLFDGADGMWKVTWLSMPQYQTGIWEGTQVGDEIVLDREIQGPQGGSLTIRLTFFDVTESSYSWKAETIRGDRVTSFWEKDCTRTE